MNAAHPCTAGKGHLDSRHRAAPSEARLGQGLDQAFVAALATLLRDRFTRSREVREHHGPDESHFPPIAPDAVAVMRDIERALDPDDLLDPGKVVVL